MMQLEVGVAQYHVITFRSCDQQELSKSFTESQPEVSIDYNEELMMSSIMISLIDDIISSILWHDP